MTFIDLAWAAFIYKGLGGDKAYMEIMVKDDEGEFLQLLRLNPVGIHFNGFKKNLMLFLSRWNCRVSKKVGKKLLTRLKKEHELIGRLQDRNLITLTEAEVQQAGAIYGRLTKISGVKVAIATKTLHVLNPSVFVPTDNPILEKLNIEKSQAGYTEFMKLARQNAVEITNDFQRRGFAGSPENYLSEKLKYHPYKTLAKYIDEYYWVTKTNEFKIPPEWNPTQI